ncbi:DUF1801 domain-containing protein [Enterococcus sp. AZ196]|uniref:DUF1801 domain-containing protein n=1 Tax=Enterococcus sp. AZ196 TaxID=2774659 RepID=UPI003D2B7228
MDLFNDSNVKRKFDGYSAEQKTALLEIRQLIFDISREVAPDESLVENLKWNQPSYTAKKGTPIRLDTFGDDNIAIFFHCQTHLIEQFREMFQDELTFSKNRAIIIDPDAPLPIENLRICIQMGLTYHKNK